MSWMNLSHDQRQAGAVAHHPIFPVPQTLSFLRLTRRRKRGFGPTACPPKVGAWRHVAAAAHASDIDTDLTIFLRPRWRLLRRTLVPP